jgi:hypothetical protein
MCIRGYCSRHSCKAHCLEANGCQSPAHRGSTTGMTRRNHLLLPLAPPPSALPLMTRLAPPSNMFVTPPPLSQLQIDLALQAAVPPRLSSTAPPSSSIDACASPRFAFHMFWIFMEQWATKQRVREEQRERDSSHLRNLQKTTHHFCVCVGPYMLLAQLSFLSPTLH